MTFIIFVISFLMTSNGESDSRMRYDLSLNKGAVLSYINADYNKNSFSESEKNTKNNFVTVIVESRISCSNDNNVFDINGCCFSQNNVSKALYSYIQNYSCNRVLHPPLEKLGVLLI